MLKLQLLSFLVVGLANASARLETRGLCEPVERICYGAQGQGGTSQKIKTEDIEYVASYLRKHGCDKAAIFTMPSGFKCEEWTVETPGSRTVLVLAKHVNPRTQSSVAFEDIANTIDGGENASEADKNKSLLGCGENGGSFGVQVNLTNEIYNSEDFKKGKGKAQNIIIKLVWQPESK